MTYTYTVQRAVAAIEAYREWAERVARVAAPFRSERVPVRREMAKVELLEEPPMMLNETRADYMLRTRPIRDENRLRLKPYADQLKEIALREAKVLRRHPQPATADAIVDEVAKGDLKLWSKIMNEVTAEHRRIYGRVYAPDVEDAA